MRVSSEGTQKRIIILGEPLAPDEAPDRLALYQPDGTPIDLGPTTMRWRDTWSELNSYVTNDVVNLGSSVFIFQGDTAAPGDPGPGQPLNEWVLVSSSDALRWAGVYDEEDAYDKNSVVNFEGDLWMAPVPLDVGIVPGEIAGPPMATGTFKAGNALFGGTTRHGYALQEGVILTAIYEDDATGGILFAPVGGVKSNYIKLTATPGAEVTLTFDAQIGLNDAADGSGLPDPDDEALSSPWTFIMPASGIVAIEHQASGTFLLWGDEVPPAEWVLMMEAGSGGGGGGGDLEDWHVVGDSGEPAFTNSWVASGSADFLPRFRKRPDGLVELRGLTLSGTTDTAIFTLPVGYRPDSPGGLQFIVLAAATGTGAAVLARVDVNPDGTVMSYISGSSIVWLSLNQILFSTD